MQFLPDPRKFVSCYFNSNVHNTYANSFRLSREVCYTFIMKKLLLLTAMTLSLWGCNFFNPMTVTTVTLGDQTFSCEIADSQSKREHGLMEREQLPENHGMLFVFEKLDVHTFWMKNTPLALDIIWIDEHDQVSHFVTAQPCETKICPTFSSDKKAKYVLEVAAGTFTGKLGDTISIKN